MFDYTSISDSLINELKNLRIDLSVYWGMQVIKNGELNNSHKHIISALKRKMWIEDDLKYLNIAGLDVLRQLEELEKNPKELKKRQIEDNFKEALRNKFEEWWSIYPSSNNFTFRSIPFIGTQSKKIKKDDCFDVFCKLTLKFNPDVIIAATSNHVEIAKIESYNKGVNQITFIPNSYRYLKEELFIPFIKESGEEENKTFKNFEI